MTRKMTLMAAALLVSAGGAQAAGASTPLLAQPVAPVADGSFVARDNAWRCSGGTCSSAIANARPPIACAALVREVGALRSFRVGGQDFSADQLSACNRRAR